MLLHCHVEETREACAALLVRSFRISFVEDQVKSQISFIFLFLIALLLAFRRPFWRSALKIILNQTQRFDIHIEMKRVLLWHWYFCVKFWKNSNSCHTIGEHFQIIFLSWGTFPLHYHIEFLLFNFREIALAEPYIRTYLLQIGFLPRLFDLFLGEDSPNAKKNTRKMGDKYAQPDFTHLLSLISILVCSLQVPGTQLLRVIIHSFFIFFLCTRLSLIFLQTPPHWHFQLLEIFQWMMAWWI